MKKNCSNSACCVYSTLIGNILINMFILVILMLSCYNFLTLSIFQKAYLVFAIINWMMLFFYSFFKFFLIIFGKFSAQNQPKKIWLYVHLPGYFIIVIAILYDAIVVSITSGIGGILIYYMILIFWSATFFIITLLDYCGIKGQLEISRKKTNRYILHEEKVNKDTNKSINAVQDTSSSINPESSIIKQNN